MFKRFIRRLIKSENKQLFDNNPSEVRKLSRYLEKAFKNENKATPESENSQDVIYKLRILNNEMLKLYQDIEAIEALEGLIPEIQNDEQINMLKILKKL